MWDDLVDFGKTILPAYRRNVWASQACYVEVWLEKDALSGIFEDVLEPYGVTLNVGRGYDGWDSIHNLTLDGVRGHNLPPDFTKATDTRQKGFVTKYGDIAVELDALPVDVLVQRLTNEVESRMDLNALGETKKVEETERARLANAIQAF